MENTSNLKLTMIFDNEHFVVVDKPASWLSVPSRLGEKDPRPVVGTFLEKNMKVKIFPTHRLDQEVSGLLLFAKQPEAHRVANGWFENKMILKTYEAITDANPIPPWPKNETLQWSCELLRGKKRVYESPHGKPSLTIASWVDVVTHHSREGILWRLNPITGRSHQLRFELARHEFPIWGDELYGSKASYIEEGIALRSVQMKFPADDAQRFGLPAILNVDGILK